MSQNLSAGKGRSRAIRLAVLLAIVIAAAMALIAHTPGAAAAPKQAKLPKTVRLYVFDCGWLKVEDPVRFNFKREELAVLDLSAPCFLVAHPKGTLMWDTGVVPDSAFKAGGGPATKEYATATKPLLPQLAQAGFTPADITYVALSHVHWDHAANISRWPVANNWPSAFGIRQLGTGNWQSAIGNRQ